MCYMFSTAEQLHLQFLQWNMGNSMSSMFSNMSPKTKEIGAQFLVLGLSTAAGYFALMKLLSRLDPTDGDKKKSLAIVSILLLIVVYLSR